MSRHRSTLLVSIRRIPRVVRTKQTMLTSTWGVQKMLKDMAAVVVAAAVVAAVVAAMVAVAVAVARPIVTRGSLEISRKLNNKHLT